MNSASAPAPEDFPDLVLGAVLCDRYELLQFIGKGGMGAVYKACDRWITGEGREETIALKLILPKLAKRPELLRRFKDEIYHARHITHKNVVRVFDFQRDGELVFITMELVEGDDLGTLLDSREKYPPEEAADIIQQIACGLQAAHEANVIHRDLKPRNVVMQRNGRVVVMDFGLARVLEPGEETQTVGIWGTPRYMSPEQRLGEQIDHRSDIYALGIIFHELLTGDVPSERSRRSSAPAQRGDVTEPKPYIPAPLEGIVRKCLAQDPNERYQSAQQVVSELESWRFPKTKTTASRRGKYVWWGGVLAALASVLIATVVFLLFSRSASTATHTPVSLLIADFDNRSGEGIFSGGTIESVLGVSLETAPFITSYDRGTAHKTAQQLSGADTLTESIANQISVREGIQVVIAGTLSRSGSGFELSVRAEEAGATKPLFSRTTSAPDKEQVLTSISQVGASIRKALGDRDTRSWRHETFTAASLPAIHAYAIAQEHALEGKYDSAIPQYLEAIRLDPKFGRAYAGLAVVYRNKNQADEALTYYGDALKHLDRMTDREKYRTRGGYYFAAGNPEKALDEYSELVKHYPADNAGLANVALAWFFLRDMAKASEYGRRALEIYPKNVSQRNNLAFYAMADGEFDVAITEASKAIEMNKSYEKAYVVIALSQLAQGHRQQAEETYGKLKPVSSFGASLADMGLADIALYEGRVTNAVEILERASKEDLARGARLAAAVKLATLAQAYVDLGRMDQARDSAKRALDLGIERVQVLFPIARVYLAINRSVPDEIPARLEKSLQSDSRAYAKLIRGEAKLQAGHPEEAVRDFTEAHRLSDMWIGRFDMGRAYFEAKQFAEADSEFEACMRRRGEATAVFLDDLPSFRYFPPVYYYYARAEEGLKVPAAKDLYRIFVSIKQSGSRDSLVEDAKQRLHE